MPSLAYKPYYGTADMPKKASEKEGSSKPSSKGRKLDEGAVDDITAILRLEHAHYLPAYDYLTHNNSYQNTSECVTEEYRHKVCDWAYKIVDCQGFDREVVSIAMNYLDRMSSITAITTKGPVTTNFYRLVALSSLYLAIKLHGEVDVSMADNPRMIEVEAFSRLSRFPVQTIESMECDILSTLEWHVNPPSMLCFIQTLLRFLPDSWGCEPVDNCIAGQLYETARFFTELVVYLPSFSFHFKSSEIAYAAIICALDCLWNKMPFPYEARLAFQDNVAAATGMTPKSKNIRDACFQIKGLDQFPYKYEEINAPMPAGGLSRSSSVGSDGGTASPVCVCEPINNKVQQKRTRLTYE